MITRAPRDHLAERIKYVLRFDRFYSRRLREAAKVARGSEVNTAELGIFQELLRGPCTPGWLSWRLDLDPAYLSRSLKRLQLIRLVSVRGSDGDRRRRQVSLTDQGSTVARGLEQARVDAVRKVLDELPLRQQKRLVLAMNVIVGIFEQDALTNLLERITGEHP
jgi:DNA-binding MarR family transcriptional regulator